MECFIIVAYCIFCLSCAGWALWSILNDPGDDPYGMPIRHRWDIPLMMLLVGPPLLLFEGIVGGIDWCWKKLVD